MNKKQREMVVSAMAKTLVIIYAVILIIGIAKAAAARSITAGFLELIFAVAVPILVYLFVRGRKKVTFPMTIAGMEVRPESSRKALRGRLRAYIRDSLPYAGAAALFLGAADIWQAGSSGTLAGWGLSGWLDILGSVLVEYNNAGVWLEKADAE